MAVRRSAAPVLVALVLVSVVTASVGVVAAQPGDDTLDGGVDENTTDGTTDTVDDTTDSVTDSTDGVDSATGDDGPSTDDGTTDSDSTVVGDGDSTTAVSVDGDESTDSTATVEDGTGDLDEPVESGGVASAAADELLQATDASVGTLEETTGALSATLETDVTTSGLLVGGESGNTDQSASGGSAREASADTATRESADWARERTRVAADGEPAELSAGAGTDAGPVDGAPAPRRLPLPEHGAVATAFVAGVVAVARPPVVSQRGAGQLVGAAARRLTAEFGDLRRLLVGAGYSRYDDSDPLDHDARAALYDAVDAEPGVHLSALAERADVNLSTARHHVRVLEDENLLTSAKTRGKRRYYPAAAAEDVELAAALAEPATAAVLEALARLGDAHVGLLADELDRDPSTVSHHLQRLADDGLVERERRGRAVVSSLADPVEDAVAAGESAPADD